MLSEIEQNEQNPHLLAAAAATRQAPCTLLHPAGLGCSKPAGHEPPCAPVPIDTEPPPAADPSREVSAPAASSAPQRKYGIRKRKQFDVDLPSGDFVRVRQLSLSKAIELGMLSMKDSFSPQLLKDINDADPEVSEAAGEKLEDALKDPDRREKFFGPLNRIAAAALVCPTAILEGEPIGDDQIHVEDIDMKDKMAIFEAAMPEEMKFAALEEQHDALKSVRGEQDSGVRDIRDGDSVPQASE